MVLTLLKRRRVLIGLVAALLVGGLLQATNTNPAVSQQLYLTAYQASDDPGLDPQSKEWQGVSTIRVPLAAQSGSYAAGGGSVQQVTAQALHYEGKLYVRVSWDDPTADQSTTRVEDFSDGVALEFPSDATATVPSVCMGQADSGVNIWHWRADSDAGVKNPSEIYPNSLIDGVPFEEKLFYTAREAGNPYANPDVGAVQTLASRAFGELTALSVQDVSGHGVRTATGWAVVFSRKLESTNTDHASFSTSTKTDMAFAVWDGEKDERNGRKSVSTFVTLSIANAAAKDEAGGGMFWVLAAIGMLGIFTVLGVGLAVYGYSERKA